MEWRNEELIRVGLGNHIRFVQIYGWLSLKTFMHPEIQTIAGPSAHFICPLNDHLPIPHMQYFTAYFPFLWYL